jgi:hypothetical protein
MEDDANKVSLRLIQNSATKCLLWSVSKFNAGLLQQLFLNHTGMENLPCSTANLLNKFHTTILVLIHIVDDDASP